MPDTTEEAWRFTDLRGFDPDAFAAEPDRGDVPDRVDAARARRRRLGRGHRDRDRDRAAPAIEGVRFEPLDEDDPRLLLARRLGREVRGAQRRGVEARPARARARRASSSSSRSTCGSPTRSTGGSLFWRLLVVAEEGSRFTLIEEYASARARPQRLHERGRRALRRAGGEVRVRLDPEPLARDLALRHAPRARRARRASSTGSPAASARRTGRSASRTTSTARARPRGSPARTSPTATSTSTTTRSRSTSPRRPSPTSRSRARCASRRTRCGAG